MNGWMYELEVYYYNILYDNSTNRCTEVNWYFVFRILYVREQTKIEGF